MSKDFRSFARFLCFGVLLCVGVPTGAGQYQSFLEHENALYDYVDDSHPIVYLPNGDSEFAQLALDRPVNFYNEKYDQIFINTNGILTFNIDFAEYINLPLPLDYPSIVPFYANVDTTGANQATSISIFETKNPEQLARANNFIRLAFIEKPLFEAEKLIVATWRNVGYFNGKKDQLNTFQVVVIVNDEETFVQYIYPERGINWVRAEAGDLGLPDIRAQAGFVAEDGTFFTLEDSGTRHVRFLSENSNVGVSGVWLYQVGPLEPSENIQSPTNVEFLTEPPVYQLESCAEGSHKYCDENASCMDKRQGFCCSCRDGYFGNGHVCLKNDESIRISGSLSGTINGQPLDERAKLQSYVSTSDAHTYTVVTPLSSEFAAHLRLALPLVTAVGWLFAKPINGASNGYQLTGGEMKHFSELHFNTGEVLTVNQTFEGLDYWDQLSIKIDIHGDVPYVGSSSQLLMNDFIEEFRFISPNQLHSMQNYLLEVANENRIIQFQMDQSIQFKRCLLDDESNSSGDIVLQKVSRITLDYSDREQAWRPSLLTKIGVDVESNACNDGTAHCGENTICNPYEDTYRCDCLNGFEPEIGANGFERCIDIDECAIGAHYCDENAICTNTRGGFTCMCPDGFEGDGHTCLLNNPADNIESSTAASPEPNPQEDHTFEEYTPPSQEPIYNTIDDCHRCSPDADCYNGQCACRDGFHGDGYHCESNCKSGEYWEDGSCFQTVYDHTDDHEMEPKCNLLGDCSCIEGYELDPERQMCRYIGLGVFEDQVPCDVENNCHSDATCDWNEAELKYVCNCKPDFYGDGYRCFVAEESCAIRPEMCDAHASCNYNEALGRSECQCDRGYDGDGFRCNITPECQTDLDCGNGAYCDNGVCQCNDGYERDLSDDCVPAGRCGPVSCGPNTICRYDSVQDVPYCDCMDGYEGDALIGCKSIPPPCNIRNNCGLHAKCEPTEDPQRYECQCNAGYHGDGYECIEDENCLNNPHLCDMNARCLSTNNGLICVCHDGFYGNGSLCLERQRYESGFLIVSQGVAIVRVPLNGKNIRPIAITQMAIGLDKDCLEGRIYWGDISAKKILSAKYDGSDPRDFISTDIESPEGIAIDFISRRIYWTDSVKDTIEVASLDNSTLRAVLVTKNLVNPRGIVVDPMREKLYWSDWNRESPKIEMSDLDGTGRETLLGSEKVKLPNSLIVLEETGELCYADAGTKTVECINEYTRQTRTISSDLTYPFGLANIEGVFYWTDWTTKKLESVDALGVRQKGLQTPFFGSHKMFGMAAVDNICPELDSPCHINNGGCTDTRICLINRKAPSGTSCKCILSSGLCSSPSQYGYSS